MSDKDIAIRVKNLHKTFRIPLEGGNNLKQRIVNFATRKKGYREFSPLNGVSFEIKKGEFFGIVGRNGSGKSTLLKTIAGIYEADSGYVKVNGTLVPFIELGVGFNPDLTGRENLYLNGALLGFSHEEMEAMYDDIVDFAELHDFMDEKLKNYSSGMQVRLAFSIAIRADGDILLLDEVLAVGDSAFQQKCYSYFYDLKKKNKTVVLVTHSMSAVEKYCDKALLIQDGKVKSIGSSIEIAQQYEEQFISSGDQKDKNSSTDHPTQHNVSVEVDVSVKGKATKDVKILDIFNINISVFAHNDIEAGNIGINIRNEEEKVVFSTDTARHVGEKRFKKGQKREFNLELENRYTNGEYTIDINVVDEAAQDVALLARLRSVATFTVRGVTAHAHSMFHPSFSVREDENAKP